MIELTGNERFAWDAYRRFMQMFGDVVMGMEHEHFEHALQSRQGQAQGVKLDTELDVDGLKEVVDGYKKVYKKRRQDVPAGPARAARRPPSTPSSAPGTTPAPSSTASSTTSAACWARPSTCRRWSSATWATTSGTGVAFTRDPSTGENEFYGEYLINAQGEDVVAGIRTPQPISELAKVDPKSLQAARRHPQEAREALPRHAGPRVHHRAGQAVHAADPHRQADRGRGRQDRRGHGQGKAHHRERGRAAGRRPRQLDQLLHPMFDPKAEKAADADRQGPARQPRRRDRHRSSSPPTRPRRGPTDGKKVILVRIETSPEDIGGMNAAKGILTSRGGMTSHAAVVARGMGKCCVAGCGDVVIDYKTKTLTVGGKTLKEGDWISLNGSTGAVYAGKVDTVDPTLTGPFGTIMKLADKYRTLGVRTNADTPARHRASPSSSAPRASACAAPSTCSSRATASSPCAKMILAERRRGPAEGPQGAPAAPAEGLQRHLQGPEGPPGHHPLPRPAAARVRAARRGGPEGNGQGDGRLRRADQGRTVDALHEFNPMLGHRGCRLGITYPEITAMQARAVIEAAYAVKGAKARDHDPAGRQRQGTRPPEADRASTSRAGQGREEGQEGPPRSRSAR